MAFLGGGKLLIPVVQKLPTPPVLLVPLPSEVVALLSR